MVLALLAALLFPAEAPSLDLSPDACARCHAQAAQQWRRSPHATARTDPLFVASLKRARLRWCVDCHAPPLDLPDAGSARSVGVDCAACHVRDGRVLTPHSPTVEGLRAHPMARDATLGDSSSCARCHQFNVPVSLRPPIEPGAEPMQDTYREWQASAAAAHDVPCQGCHMKHGTHDMEGGHDVELLRRTVSMQFARVDGGWTAALVATGAAHRVPTGDPFRRFELLVCPTPDCSTVLATRTFGREFSERSSDAGPHASQFVMTRDLTAHPHLDGGTPSAPRAFVAPAGGFAWRLRYRLDEPELADQVPRESWLLDIHSGVIGLDGGTLD